MAVDEAIQKLFEQVQQSLPKDQVPCYHCEQMEHRWPKVEQNVEFVDFTTV